jgi:hypothetical protein
MKMVFIISISREFERKFRYISLRCIVLSVNIVDLKIYTLVLSFEQNPDYRITSGHNLHINLLQISRGKIAGTLAKIWHTSFSTFIFSFRRQDS